MPHGERTGNSEMDQKKIYGSLCWDFLESQEDVVFERPLIKIRPMMDSRDKLASDKGWHSGNNVRCTCETTTTHLFWINSPLTLISSQKRFNFGFSPFIELFVLSPFAFVRDIFRKWSETSKSFLNSKWSWPWKPPSPFCVLILRSYFVLWLVCFCVCLTGNYKFL